MTFFNKLIRDLIPQIIEKTGKQAICRIANSDEYWELLKTKLFEEAKEFIESESIEELSDITEILEAILNFKKIKKEELEKVQLEKRKKRGAFEQRIVLEKVIDPLNLSRKISSRAPKIRTEEESISIHNFFHSKLSLAGSSPLIGIYEKDLQNYFNVKHAIALSSGTAAIHAALVALDIKEGDQICLPVTAPIMSAYPILAMKASPVFVDVEANTFNISLESLKKNLTPKTKAILSVPMWGSVTSNIRQLKLFAEKHGLYLIEDCAQAIGTKNAMGLEGTNGDIGCFSTHEFKLISTGEGGFVITNYENIAKKIRAFSRFGMDTSIGESFGLNYKFNGLGAALGIAQLKTLDARIKKRQERAQLLFSHLKNISPLATENIYLQNHYGFVSLLQKKLNGKSKEVAEELNNKGILSDIKAYDYQMLSDYPIFSKYLSCRDTQKTFPNAYHLISSLLILPNQDYLSEEEVLWMAKQTNSILTFLGAK